MDAFSAMKKYDCESRKAHKANDFSTSNLFKGLAEQAFNAYAGVRTYQDIVAENRIKRYYTLKDNECHTIN